MTKLKKWYANLKEEDQIKTRFLGWAMLVMICFVMWSVLLLDYFEVRYTVCATTVHNRSGWKCDFKVNGNDHSGSGDQGPAGSQYFAKYSVYFPSINIILNEYRVPDSLQTAPPNGWEKLPIE